MEVVREVHKYELSLKLESIDQQPIPPELKPEIEEVCDALFDKVAAIFDEYELKKGRD